ncbi:MAG: D-amino acid aminotransferase [Candidatus Sumerlaeota bacterium]|nr:D-amino acid aminotransferase [Candidatus Sumerlaeota bacterium]
MPTPADEILFLNGEFLPLSEGRVSIEDRGFQFADGIYEVARIWNGRLFRLEPHLKRMERSAQGISLPLEYGRAEMARVCLELTERSGLQRGMIYIQVTRGAARRSHALTGEAIRPTTLAYARAVEPPSPESWEAGWKAISRLDDRWQHCDLKTIALLPNILGKMEAVRHGADEVIYHGADQTVSEGGSSNLYAVIDGTIFTHPLGPKILNGITRMAVLEFCRAEGIPCREVGRTLEEFRNAQEVFLTSTTRDAIPIVSIDGRPVADGKPGLLTRRVFHGLRDIVERETSQPTETQSPISSKRT